MGQVKPLIIPVPGFNSEGEYVHSFCPWFTNLGFVCRPFLYGKAAWTTLGNIIANRLRMEKVAGDLVNKIDKHHGEVILICHSNGLALSYLAQKACKNVIGVVSFNGALDSGLKFRQPDPDDRDPGCWVINCYHEGDWVLNLGRLRPGHLWGNYGKTRQAGILVSNYDLGRHVKGWNPHSAFLKEMEDIMPEIIHMINVRIQKCQSK